MCMAFERECACGKESARLHHLNSILPYESVENIYCPDCSGKVSFDEATMMKDNGWVIKYNIEVAAQFAQKLGLTEKQMTPERIFDQGHSSWQGFTPNDMAQANEEKMELAKLAKTNPQEYLTAIREWTLNRAQKLRKEGWRKAREAVEV